MKHSYEKVGDHWEPKEKRGPSDDKVVASTLKGIDGGDLVSRPAGTGNSIAWLIWHLSRIEDTQVADVAGLEQVWTRQGFRGRFRLPLPEHDTGYLHTTGQVDAVKAPPELLLECYDAVHRQTVEFLNTVGDEDFDRIVN